MIEILRFAARQASRTDDWFDASFLQFPGLLANGGSGWRPRWGAAVTPVELS
jgi:hypothetical protein